MLPRGLGSCSHRALGLVSPGAEVSIEYAVSALRGCLPVADLPAEVPVVGGGQETPRTSSAPGSTRKGTSSLPLLTASVSPLAEVRASTEAGWESTSLKKSQGKPQNHSSSCSLSNAGEVLQLLRSIQADGEGVQVRGQQAGRGRGRVAVGVPARGSCSQQEGAGSSPAAVPHPRINVAQGRAPLPGTSSPGAARQQEGAVPGERRIPSAAGAISSTTWTGTRRRSS